MKTKLNGVGLVCEGGVPILCAVCYQPFGPQEWNDRHEPSDDSDDVYHADCCPDCKAASSASTEYPGIKLAKVQKAIQMEMANTMMQEDWPKSWFGQVMVIQLGSAAIAQTVKRMDHGEIDTADGMKQMRSRVMTLAASCERFLMEMDD